MALSIRNPELESLARSLSDRTGQNMTDLILSTLRERQRSLDGQSTRQERLLALVDSFRALPDFDARSPQEILGYGDEGGFSHGG
jgi:hypothetical protein